MNDAAARPSRQSELSSTFTTVDGERDVVSAGGERVRNRHGGPSLGASASPQLEDTDTRIRCGAALLLVGRSTVTLIDGRTTSTLMHERDIPQHPMMRPTEGANCVREVQSTEQMP